MRKENKTMSNQKNWKPFQFPPFDMDWDLSSYRNQWNEFKANVDKAWDKYQEMQKEAQKAWKEQWETFFDQCIEVQKAFAENMTEKKSGGIAGKGQRTRREAERRYL